MLPGLLVPQVHQVNQGPMVPRVHQGPMVLVVQEESEGLEANVVLPVMILMVMLDCVQ